MSGMQQQGTGCKAAEDYAEMISLPHKWTDGPVKAAYRYCHSRADRWPALECSEQ